MLPGKFICPSPDSPFRLAGRVRHKTGGNGSPVGIQSDNPACACRLHLFQITLGQKPGERGLGLLQTAVYLFFHHTPSRHTFHGIDGLRIPQKITENFRDRGPRWFWIGGVHHAHSAPDGPESNAWKSLARSRRCESQIGLAVEVLGWMPPAFSAASVK